MSDESDVGVPNSEPEVQSLVPATSTPSIQEIEILTSLAATLSKSGLEAARKSPEQTLAIALLGRELGVPIMASLQNIYISAQGKPSFSASLTASLLARGGVTWDIELNQSDQAVVCFHRKGWKDVKSSFTMTEASQAGLTGKDAWRKYPADMLWARAFTRGARKIGPDLLAGFGGYTPDELGGEDHDPEFVPGRSASPPTTTTEAPRRVESKVVSPAPESVDVEEVPSIHEEIRPNLLELIEEMLAENSRLRLPKDLTLSNCIALLRGYRASGNTWEEIESRLTAGIDRIHEAVRVQTEGAVNAE